MAWSKRAKKKLSDAMKSRWAAKKAAEKSFNEGQKEAIFGAMPEKPEGGSYNQVGSGLHYTETVKTQHFMTIRISRPDGSLITIEH